MIRSVWKISFLVSSGPRAGEAIVLLDHGDDMEAEPKLPVSQGVATSAPIFSPFGHAFALGSALHTATWSRRRTLTTALPRTQALMDAYRFPWGDQGRLRAQLLDGATWEWDRSAVESIEPSYPPHSRRSYLLQAYSAKCGPLRLVAGPLPTGTAATWDFLVPGVCPNWESITTPWPQILSTPIN